VDATRTRSVRGAQFDRLQFHARLFIVYALAAAATLPMIGPHRYRLALFLALIVGPAHFVIRWLTGVPNPTGWLELLAVVSGTVAAALKPSVWPACLLFQMLTVAAAVAYLPPVWTFTLAGISIVSMAILAVLQPVPGATADDDRQRGVRPGPLLRIRAPPHSRAPLEAANRRRGQLAADGRVGG
jgi:hypothetical protein